jgi:hypothetical protein
MDCKGEWKCNALNALVSAVVELFMVQYVVAPADYFRPWWHLDSYFRKSYFLPDFNNELGEKN